MKILVSTTRTQGRRPNDFCHVPEGEPVMFGVECDRERVDGRCGCRRSMVGVECHRATTTVTVADVPHDREWLLDAYARSMRKAGWKVGREELAPTVDAVLDVASRFEAGTVLERRGNKFNVRKD